jgi:predicted amidophosphoribosyltransferase
MPTPPAVDACRALVTYDDAGRRLVTALKYGNARSVVAWLAAAMAHLVVASGWPVDAVTWVPTTSARRGRRGFDQAELLARGVAAHLGVPCRAYLLRGPGPAQTDRDLDGRRRGPTIVGRGRPPPTILLVDDVVTTGSTVSAGARALRAAGADRVVVVAAARTPLKAPWQRSETR